MPQAKYAICLRGNRFSFLYGHAREFTAEELAELYPDPETFVEKYDEALEEVMDAGVVLAEDGPAYAGRRGSELQREHPDGGPTFG